MMPVRALAARPAPGVAASRRTFWTRLLLPRFRDVVFKWAFLPTGALVAVSVGGHSLTGRDVVQLLLLWVVVEQLAYQARYLVNDLRDRVTDAQHPAGAQKSRLAFPMTPARLVGTWASVAARLVLALLISVLVLDGTFGEAALGFIVLLLPVSALYEAARNRIRREDAEPASLRARTLALPVLLSVPLGYGLRVWAGYHALKPPADPWWHVGLLVVTALLLQLATVMLGWALEATTYLRSEPPGYDPRLRGRGHIAVLARHAGLLGRAGDGSAGDVDARTLLVGRDRPAAGPADLRAWDLAAAAALLLAYLTAVLAVDAPDVAVLTAVVVAGASAAAPSVVHLAARHARSPLPWRPWLGRGRLATVVAVEAILWSTGLVVVLLVEPGAARLWWLPGFALLQWGFVRASSYASGYGPLSMLMRPLLWARHRAAATG